MNDPSRLRDDPGRDPPSTRRTSASAVVKACPARVFAAFLDPAELVEWLPPGGMTGVFHAFDARAGGGYVMSLFYPSGQRTPRGKTAEREDRVRVRFVELQPPRRIVEAVRFDSEDPAFGGEMTIMIDFDPVPAGTCVRMVCTDLPPGLRPEDNEAGTRQSLAQLARRFGAKAQPASPAG